MMVMMCPVSMRVAVISPMVVSALSVAVVSPAHNDGWWGHHDRGRRYEDWGWSHDDRHANAHGDIHPRVGRQGQRETGEPQDYDETTPLQDHGETLHSAL